MAVRTVHRFVQEARHVAAGAAGLAGRVARHFEARHRHLAPAAGEMLDVERFQRHLGEVLATAAEKLQQADFAVERQRSHGRELRRRRDERAKQLYERLVRLRKVATGFDGGGDVGRRLGFDGKTPREPAPLAGLGRTVLRRLADDGLALSDSLPRGVSLDRGALAAALAPAVAALEQALEAVGESAADETVLLVERDELFAQLRELKTGVARILEGLYLAAGLAHLVPGIRRPRRTAAHRSAGRRQPQTPVPHRSGGRAFHETTTSHRLGTALDELASNEEGFPGRTKLRPTPAHRFGGRLERVKTAREGFGGGLVVVTIGREGFGGHLGHPPAGDRAFGWRPAIVRRSGRGRPRAPAAPPRAGSPPASAA